jgi:hypothetical protein
VTCWAKSRGRGRECDLGPRGKLDRHHVVKQQWIRKVHRSLTAAYRRGQGPKPWSLKRALADSRNLVVTCWRHHAELEDGRAKVTPIGFWDFIEEHRGLEAELPRGFRDDWARRQSTPETTNA